MAEDEDYSDALHQGGRNLTRLALEKKVALPVYREQEIAGLLASIKRNRSVPLVGEVGIGKTSILHGSCCANASMSLAGLEVTPHAGRHCPP